MKHSKVILNKDFGIILPDEVINTLGWSKGAELSEERVGERIYIGKCTDWCDWCGNKNVTLTEVNGKALCAECLKRMQEGKSFEPSEKDLNGDKSRGIIAYLKEGRKVKLLNEYCENAGISPDDSLNYKLDNKTVILWKAE